MRKIQSLYRTVDHTVQPTGDDVVSANRLHNWLERAGNQVDAKWALLHSDLGIRWGKFEEQQLIFSTNRFPEHDVAILEPTAFQRCYLFGPNAELLLWKEATQWRARSFRDETETSASSTAAAEAHWYYDEAQILAGTEAVLDDKAQQVAEGFTLTADGIEGLYHAVPLTEIAFAEAKRRWRPLRLMVRHYLQQDAESGALYVESGRLLDLGQCEADTATATGSEQGEEQENG